MVRTQTLALSTRGNADCQDITGRLAKAVAESMIECGTLTIFCPSSTSALTTLEFEPGAIVDMARLFDEIIPPGRDYAHNARWGDGNGHSHLRAALTGSFADHSLHPRRTHTGDLAAGGLHRL